MKAFVFIFVVLSLASQGMPTKKGLRDIWHLKSPTLWAMFSLGPVDSLEKRQDREKEIELLLAEEAAKATDDPKALARIQKESSYVDEIGKIIRWPEWENFYSSFIKSLIQQQVELTLPASVIPEGFAPEELGMGFLHLKMLQEFRDSLKKAQSEHTGKLYPHELREKFAEFLSNEYSKVFPHGYNVRKDLWSGYSDEQESRPFFWKQILSNWRLARPALYLGGACVVALGIASHFFKDDLSPADRMRGNSAIPESHTAPAQLYTPPPRNLEKEAGKAIQEHPGFDPKKLDD